MKWRYIPGILFFLGLTLFYHKAEFGYVIVENGAAKYVSTIWDKLYFFWDKSMIFLFVWLIYYLLPKEDKGFYKAIFAFTIIRLLWEIVASVTKLDINNPKIIGIIFILFLLIWIYPAIKNGWQWLKQKF